VYLMVSTHVRLIVLGVNPLQKSAALDLWMGTALWDLSLGRHTSDGKFDGESFWVGCGCFFLGGGRGGEEELQGTYCNLFSQDDVRFQTALFMLYII
jgi:hypothetical protein